MHVLIFTGQFGMGHIAAAQAVQGGDPPPGAHRICDCAGYCGRTAFPSCTDWSTAVLILLSTTALASIICSIEWRAVTAVPQ